MSNSILVVVDMQDEFLEAFNFYNKQYLVDNCAKLIKNCIENNDPVIFLEWHDIFTDYYGSTISELTSLIKNYYTAKKDRNDGSEKILNIVEHHMLKADIIKVCGIYTNYCVAETVTGLINKFCDSEVIVYADACGTTSNGSHLRGIDLMRCGGARIEGIIP